MTLLTIYGAIAVVIALCMFVEGRNEAPTARVLGSVLVSLFWGPILTLLIGYLVSDAVRGYR